MCESCCSGHTPHDDQIEFDRRSFIKGGATVLGTAGMILGGSSFISAMAADLGGEMFPPLKKSKAKVKVLFMYPPQEIIESGKFEDIWAEHKWSTWPGLPFKPSDREVQYLGKTKEIAQRLDVELDIHPAIYTKAAVAAFIEQTKAEKPDALLIFCFWNTMQSWAKGICDQVGVPSILYVPVGANHQTPKISSAKNFYFIHSYENWDEIEGALRCVRAHKSLAQSRIIRVGDYQKEEITVPSGSNVNRLNIEIASVPADIYNSIFDSIKDSDELLAMAKTLKQQAKFIEDVTDEYINHGIRSYLTLEALKKRYNADGITIKCLMLKERKPCIGFSLENSAMSPCACEDCADSLTTLMLGTQLIDRGGFMHNPDFDINRNQYYGAHCTTPLKMYPDYENKPQLPFHIRPFVHMLPKSAAIDAQFPQGADGFVSKFTFDGVLSAFTGKIIDSPAITSAGGCATRFRMDIDKVDPVTNIYRGVHPILFLADPKMAKWFKTFAMLYGYSWRGNC